MTTETLLTIHTALNNRIAWLEGKPQREALGEEYVSHQIHACYEALTELGFMVKVAK